MKKMPQEIKQTSYYSKAYALGRDAAKCGETIKDCPVKNWQSCKNMDAWRAEGGTGVYVGKKKRGYLPLKNEVMLKNMAPLP